MTPKSLINMILTGEPIPERYRSLVAHSLHNDQHLKYAMRVAELRARGEGLHDAGGAFDRVAHETGASISAVKRAWSKYKDLLDWCR